MKTYPTELVDDIVKYHFKGKEELLAEAIIQQDPVFAEKLLDELQMQLLLKVKEDKDDRSD